MSRQIKDELQDKIEAKGIHILTKRTASGGGLLIFVNSNEDIENIKINKVWFETPGKLYRGGQA